MFKGPQRERLIRLVITTLVLPIVTSVLGVSTPSAYAAATCTGPKIIGVEYSKDRLPTPEANLAWKRGTNTALSELLPTVLEWKRGTQTALNIISISKLSLATFKSENPNTTTPDVQFFDDHFDTQTAVTKANEWANNPCFMALIGPMQSYIAKAIIPIYSSAGIPILSPSASDPTLTTGGLTTFHRLVLPEDPQDLRTINTLKSLGITKPAIFEDNESTPERLSRWAKSPGLPAYSLLEWKRGTPTVTVKTEMVLDAKAKGVNGYLFNGVSSYRYVNGSNDFGDAWPLVGEFTEVCPTCTGLVFGEYTNAAYIDYKYFDGTGVEGAKILSTSIPLWYGNPNFAFTEDYYSQEGPYATPTFDALRFALEGIKAGSTTPQALNTFINTKKFNGISGPVSFDTNGELAGRSQLVFTVINGQRVLTSGLPSGYVANGQVSNYSPVVTTSYSVPLQIKDFNESLTASVVDVSSGSLVKRYSVGATGVINISLPNGTSYISLTPDDDTEIGVRRSQFEIVMSSGSVTSFKNFTTGVAVTNTSSRYQIRLATPTAIGTVVSTVGYAGEQYNLTVQQSSNGKLSAYLDGKFRRDNKIYITTIARYPARGNLWAWNKEDWSHRGSSEESFTASNLSGNGFIFNINPPLAKVTGQAIGEFGPNSYAELRATFNNYSNPQERTTLSSDGHFGFASSRSNSSALSVRIYARNGKSVRAIANTSTFPTALLETGTVTGLTATLQTTNVSGLASLEGIGVPGVEFTVARSTGSSTFLFRSKADSSGHFELGLPIDTYTITFLGGYLESFRTTQITCVVKSGSNTCNAALGVPTVIGTISGFSNISFGHVGFLSEQSPGQWRYVNKDVFAYLRPDGTFSGYVAPGTYLMDVSFRVNGLTYGMPAGKCIVPYSGKATCNASFTSGLKFKLKTRTNQDFSGAIGYTVTSVDPSSLNTSPKGTLKYDPATGLTIPLIDGKYSVVLDPHSNSATTGSMSTFRFDVVSGHIESVTSVESQTVLLPTNDLFSLQLAKPQYQGRVSRFDGTAVETMFAIWIQPSGGSVQRIGLTAVDGEFIYNGSSKLTDGTYTIWAAPANIKMTSSQFETSRETFTITNGIANKTLLLREKAPNVTGTLTGPNGPLADTRIQFASLEMKKLGYYYPIYATTDSAGRYSTYLIPGSNFAFVNGDFSRGYVNLNAEITFSETSTIWNLVTHAPNVTSKVSIAGKNYDYYYHYFENVNTQSAGADANEWWQDNSTYLATYLAAGTYRLQAALYFRDSGGTTSVINLLGNLCVVPESGTVACNMELPSVNLKYSVLDYKGLGPVVGSVTGVLELKSDSNNANLNGFTKYSGSKNSENQYQGALGEGSYRIRLYPNIKSATTGISESYVFDVVGGEVKNLRAEGTTQILQPINGAYQLRLRSPALSGRVLGADGITPVAQTEVMAINNGTEFHEYTDADGYFSFDLGTPVIDGTYLVAARAKIGDASQGGSLTSEVVVTNGSSNSTTLRLRMPNVTGVVSGPLGVSKGNWIYAYRLLPNGKMDYLRWGNQSTNQSGQFGLWLEPGTYSFFSKDDLQYAGGTAARNVECVVPNSGSVICNLSLSAPNVRGTFTKNGITQNGYINIEKKNLTSGNYESIDRYSSSYQTGWAVKLDSGIYRARAYSYNDNFYYYSDEFTVVDTQTLSIAVNVPNINLRAQIVSAGGSQQINPSTLNYSSIYVARSENKSSYGLGEQSNLNKTSGIIDFRLSDGTYSLTLQSEDSQLGTPRLFRVEIESGTVKSAVESKNGSLVPIINGILQFQLNQPGISGTVIASDGTTPVPQATVAFFQNNQVCPWCERGWTNSGPNGYFAFGDVSDGEYQVYARPLESDITKGTSELSAVTVSNGQAAGGATLALRDANVSGAITGLPTRYDTAFIQVRKLDEYGNSNTPYGVYNLRANPQGNFGLFLTAGTYRFIATIYSNGWSTINSGYSQNCVVPVNGAISCDISVNTSNISLKIVTPESQTVISNSGLSIYAIQNSKNLATSSPPVYMDNTGAYKSFLEDGIWRISVSAPNNSSLYTSSYFTVTILNSVVTRLENEFGESITATSGVYFLSPRTTNLRGSITFNGSTYQSQAYVRLQTNQNGWYNEVASRWVEAGNFGFNAAPGNYRLVVDPYSDGSSNSPVITILYDCVVPETGTVSCNVPLTTGNLSGRIVDETGSTYRQAYINMHLVNDDGKSEYVQVSVSNGVFRSNLNDGKYRLTVVPYWEARGFYTEHNYEITVLGNAITTVRDLQTNETITVVSGAYNFVLGMPAIQGKVLAPGTSTLGVGSIEIRVGQDRTAKNWQYSTSSDPNGNFALTVPNGTYVIQAYPFGSNFHYGKSETQTIVVANGVATTQPELRLREPNLVGRVVTPGINPVPVAGVNVNMWIGDEYFYTYTSSNGIFGAYVESPNPDCPTRCSMYLGYYNSSDLSSKNYTISAIGNLGDKPLGGVSTRITVLAPATGAATTPNRYGYVAIEKWNPNASQYEWQPGYQTNEIGVAGLSLDTGEKYRITANPGDGKNALFSPKVLVVDSFSATDSPTVTMIFDRPNLTLQVRNVTGAQNAYGWYQVNKFDSVSGKYLLFKNAYLDEQGKGALLLPEGSFTVHFWPGKVSAGVEKEISLVVNSSGVVSGVGVSNTSLTVTLPNGNVSGYVRDQTSAGLSAAIITAVRNDDATKMSSTVSGSNGYYELNLDRTYSWTIKAIEPISTSIGQYSLGSTSPSNAATSSADISITVAS